MALEPTSVAINFSQGLNTKTDPKQVQVGEFLELENTVFTKEGLLKKRNGFGSLPDLPTTDYDYLTTFNESLVAIGDKLASLSQGIDDWTVQENNFQGSFQRCQLETLPLVRSNLNQSQADSVVSSTGLVCTVYTDQDTTDLTFPSYKYVVSDYATGQVVVQPTVITNADASAAVPASLGTPRVFLLGNYFVIIYTTFPGSDYFLEYIAVSVTDPTIVTAPVAINSFYNATTGLNFDAAVLGNTLCIAWDEGNSAGIKAASLSSLLVLSAIVNPDPAHDSTILTVTADSVNNLFWLGYYNGASTHDGYVMALNPNLSTHLSPKRVIANTAGIVNLTVSPYVASGAFTGINVFFETTHFYTYNSLTSIPTNFIQGVNVSLSGTVSAVFEVQRSAGLASKAFVVGSKIYFLTAYESSFQSTYFLVQVEGIAVVVAKVAYQNGGGYLTTGLPGVTVTGDLIQIPYLIKDLIQSVNKDTNVSAGTQVDGVYTQTGVNLGSFTLGGDIITTEIGGNLNLTGGFMWGYDGFTPVENGFFLYPDSIRVVSSTSGGSIPDGTTFYQVTYEWSDNQGNIHRSAPSIPVSVTNTGGSHSTNTIYIPTLRFTYKTVNRVKIVIYRWTTSLPVYYQTTSIEAPILNYVTSIDSVSFADIQSNTDIIGSNVIYTNGGVVENISPPACSAMTLFDDRLWLLDDEDRNLLWYSKQVIEGTPVEMSDLLTYYVAPSVLGQGSTGPISTVSAMDDKLIIFKHSAMYYVNGTGPDNTGANNQYSQPIFITSTVGCPAENQHSIVFMPQGLMFQSSKGIWLLGRDLSTTYIGAPVEAYNSDRVLSAVNIPTENQVRFTLESGTILMYDYYYSKWGTFTGVTPVSSTIYNGFHTFIDNAGDVFQETPGVYLDGANPVLLSFVTGWIKLNSVSGYQRLWQILLLGEYETPHLLDVQLAFDYESTPSEQAEITPTNEGVAGTLEQWRIQQSRQKCQAFRLYISEVYDSTLGIAAGAGFTLSAMTCVIGVLRGYRPVKAENTTGTT